MSLDFSYASSQRVDDTYQAGTEDAQTSPALSGACEKFHNVCHGEDGTILSAQDAYDAFIEIVQIARQKPEGLRSQLNQEGIGIEKISAAFRRACVRTPHSEENYYLEKLRYAIQQEGIDLRQP